MSIKSVVSVVTGFLGHHANDLVAVKDALNSLLEALPVNAQTREHISTVISQVENSAVNVSDWLDRLAAGDFTVADPSSVTIKESDIENAVLAVLRNHPELLDPAPVPAPSPAPATMAEHSPDTFAPVTPVATEPTTDNANA